VNRMLSITGSELTKIGTVRSTWITLGILLTLHILILQLQLDTYAEAVANITGDGMIELIPGRPEPAAAALIADLTAWPIQVGIFTCVLGVLTTGHEFRNGHIGTSTLAVPSRTTLVAAKTAATALIAFVFGAALTVIAVAHMYVAVRAWDPSILWQPTTLMGYARFQLFIVAFTLIGCAITLLTRRTMTALVLCGLLIGLTMTQILAALAPRIDALLPVSAARNLLLRPDLGAPLTSDPGAAALVLVAWALITSLLATFVLTRRDAR
jgi:ABC-2 type transport system permease protein